MRIYGAGLAGLICANMLRRKSPTVYEIQPKLPNNHAALLRFRTDVASKATGIPFKQVHVQKAIWHCSDLFTDTTLSLQNMYAQKVTGNVIGRSIRDISDCDRFIAPPDFIAQMASSCNFEFDASITMADINRAQTTGQPIISTIPMPVLMEIVGWPDPPVFEFRPIWTLSLVIDDPVCNVYQTIYFPDHLDSYYRASITGNLLIIEFLEEPTTNEHAVFLKEILFEAFGIHAIALTKASVKHHKYGKLLPIDENKRKAFILGMSSKYGIYSLGRFATWRQILLDNIVADVRVIENFIEYQDHYDRTLSSTNLNNEEER